ncbi:hypothetical protein AOL_s00007g397 [Orbilia oligospora ATCC 24927]|uniref:F-box domain-containing protein n=1 Tax=Arthrobotrys oligospora (strain ATCC 24927 / CBS 115.81 / DSM 1491) TaxID=756982 RepID=G1X288_ARTOA|nr:hypothetical protein AOL_s00007g397 [Orbilia oligospora ATCC 24927]EGX52614.1 hypothetical protein AOL_s00007g397 [Orbilia oligospora ATCC 24927]
MPTLQTLPLELHEKISSYLIPRDIGSLALSCKPLFHYLGPDNRLLWHHLLARGAAAGLKSYPAGYHKLLAEAHAASYKVFDDSGARDYWSEACCIFSGNMAEGCRLCLAISMRGSDREITHPTKKGVRVTKKYCKRCAVDWFVQVRKFKSRYPEIKLPVTSTLPGFGTSSHGVVAIWIAIRHIEDQSRGVPYEIARTPSNRFIASWVHQGRPRTEAIQLDEAVKFVVEIYKREYKHIQIIISDKKLYAVFTNCLELENFCPSIAEVFCFEQSGFGAVIVEISKMLGAGDDNDSRKAAEELATNIAIERILSKMFCKPDDFHPERLSAPNCILLAMEMSSALENKALSWLLKFSCLYSPPYKVNDDEEGGDDGEYDGDDEKAVCYWCLREAKGGKRETNSSFKFMKDDLGGVNSISCDWIVTHVMTAHREMLWVRPKGRMHELQICAGQLTEESESEVEELLGTKFNFENEELEDIPAESVGHDGEFLTESTYFVM